QARRVGPTPPSLRVAGFGRREARLRLGQQSGQVGVRQLGERLFARARALRRVSRHTDLTRVTAAGDEHESELVVLVRRDVSGWKDAPLFAVSGERTGWHGQE